MDAVTLLADDHEKVRRILSELEDAQGEQSMQLLARLEEKILIHATIEEELFYPSVEEAAIEQEDEERVREAYEEHHAVELLLSEIKQVQNPEQFKAKFTVIKELIEHHAAEEEQEMFPKARELLSNEELANLGKEIEARKAELETSFVTDSGFARASGAAAKRVRK